MTEKVAEPVVAPVVASVVAPVVAPVAEEDLFKGLESESFNAGVLIEEEPTAPPPVREAVEDPAAAKKDLVPESVKPKQTAQERINELTRLRREAERKAEGLEARLLELEKPPEPKLPEPKPDPDPGPKTEGPPDPTTFDYGELDPRYISALVEYQTDKRITAFRKEETEKSEQRQAAREQQAVQEQFAEKVNAGSKKHEDYYEKVVVGAEKGEWALSPDLGKMLVESDVGDDIAYHLATHPDESMEVFRQSPVEQARYFGKLEAKFSADQTAAPGKSDAKPPKAPPPVMPARGSDGKFQPSADSEDFSAFEKVVNSQE